MISSNQCEKLASASLGSVLAPKAQHIHSSLGQRPRIHRPKKTPALKVRFSSGTSSDAPQIEARLQSLDGDLNLNPWGEAPGCYGLCQERGWVL